METMSTAAFAVLMGISWGTLAVILIRENFKKGKN